MVVQECLQNSELNFFTLRTDFVHVPSLRGERLLWQPWGPSAPDVLMIGELWDDTGWSLILSVQRNKEPRKNLARLFEVADRSSIDLYRTPWKTTWCNAKRTSSTGFSSGPVVPQWDHVGSAYAIVAGTAANEHRCFYKMVGIQGFVDSNCHTCCSIKDSLQGSSYVDLAL